MREITGTFEAHDGLELFERSWHPDTEARAVVAILHGGGEHSGRYTHVAERLTAAGYRVDAFDQRSHGHSQRVRGVALQCDDVDQMLDDTDLWLTARADGPPLFVIGHSMGGLVATALATRHRLPVAGLIVLGPALRITPVDVMANAVEIAGAEPDRIVVPMGRSGFDASSRDLAMKALIDADPTHADVTGVPAGLLATTSTLGPAIRDNYTEIDRPLLAMHGTADLMADPAATAELIELAGSADKTLHLVPDGYHALLRDLDRDDTLDTIVRWIEQRIESSDTVVDGGPPSSSDA
jgi:alpha-beta hydrolase superfamily lysophospholipase